MIAAMHIKWTSKRILIGKTDLDTAYRSVHANAQIAATCIAIVSKIDFICLHLPLGTTLVLEEYTNISEVAIDLGNNLLADTS